MEETGEKGKKEAERKKGRGWKWEIVWKRDRAPPEILAYRPTVGYFQKD